MGNVIAFPSCGEERSLPLANLPPTEGSLRCPLPAVMALVDLHRFLKAIERRPADEFSEADVLCLEGIAAVLARMATKRRH